MLRPIDPPEVIILSTQRSGTHLLQSMLGSHSLVQTRGEFILDYRRRRAAGIASPELEPSEVVGFRYRRRQGFVNIGIVMYGQVAEFEAWCGPLRTSKIIHLIRDPLDVARSRLQMKRDREILGEKYRAHYHTKDTVVLPPIYRDPDESALALKVKESQEHHIRLLESENNILTISYEEICGNRQIDKLNENLAKRLFDFLGLDVEEATTGLVKTSERGGGGNGLNVDAQLADLVCENDFARGFA